MVDGAAVGIHFGTFPTPLQGTSEFDSMSLWFPACAVGSHFESGVTEGTAMRSEGLRLLGVARIDGDEGAALHLIDDEVVDVALIVSGVGDEDDASFELVDAFELPEERFGDVCVGSVVG